MSADLIPAEAARLAELEAVIRAAGYPRRRTVSVKRSDQRAHVVYVCRDATDHVLYIGISLSAMQRLGSHGQQAWFRRVARIDIEHVPDRETALRREAALIAALNPELNRDRPRIDPQESQ